MHACIAAFSSGVPVIPMAYSRKFNGLFGTLGYEHVADCKKESGEMVVKRIMEALAQRDAIQRDVAASLQHVEARLGRYEASLRNVLKRG
jgi:polysaccharide pyruvyl transferase WcaK-like protein